MGKVLGWVGGIITALWLGGLATYSARHWEAIGKLNPNALGDFLGGSMGPLALTWLVLGYLQQGIELRQNGQALNMQAEELKHAVDQYKEMARVANEQLAHDKEAVARAVAEAEMVQAREKQSRQLQVVFKGSGGSHSDISRHSVHAFNAGGLV